MSPNNYRTTPDSAGSAIGWHSQLRHPTLTDGSSLWRLAGETGTLDVNTPYAYLLWCKDFTGTSVVAEQDGAIVGFITGYRRPVSPSTLMIWQVAVAAASRGRGLATAMLEWLVTAVSNPGERLTVEASVTRDNTASHALFTGLAHRARARLVQLPGFGHELFPDNHADEPILRIGPFTPASLRRPM